MKQSKEKTKRKYTKASSLPAATWRKLYAGTLRDGKPSVKSLVEATDSPALNKFISRLEESVTEADNIHKMTLTQLRNLIHKQKVQISDLLDLQAKYIEQLNDTNDRLRITTTAFRREQHLVNHLTNYRAPDVRSIPVSKED